MSYHRIRSIVHCWALAAASMAVSGLAWGQTGSASPSPPAAAGDAPPRVVEVHIEGVIHPVSAEFVQAGMNMAQERNAALILIQLSTPGGLDTSMRQIIEKIIASRIPIAVYVAPAGSRAASAGYYILLSADIAAMAPGTNTGAAHPVLLGGQMDETMKKKVGNDAAAYLRSISAKRNRNPALAQTGVIESRSFTEQEALEGKLIDLIAPSRDELIAKLDGRVITRFDGTKVTLELSGAVIELYDPSFRQAFLARILDPNIAFLLLILGVLGLYVEFSNPGMILPGVAGGIALILGLFALSLLPVNWAGAALIVLAIVFFILEAKFTTGGIVGIGGVLAMILGALMLINTRMPGGSITLPVAVAVALPFGAITIVLLRLAVRARQAKIATGGAGMVGELGRVEAALRPEGKIFVHGELWEAVSNENIPVGTTVRVKSMRGLTLEVEPVSPQRQP